MKWQWPDGGWNCDKNPSASDSSFMETLIPLRGLAAFARIVGGRSSKSATESKVLSAVERASINPTEVFLKRRLFKRRKDGSVMSADFVVLHYPRYCHYDVLFGLKVMVEAGFIAERRCRDALDLPESKRLPGGGFAAEKKYYRVTPRRTSGRSVVDWGPTGKKRMNEFVAADALYVLKQAGRFQPA